MTYQIKCSCGAEFYITHNKEEALARNWITEEAVAFMHIHKNCCDAESKLPDDWKV